MLEYMWRGHLQCAHAITIDYLFIIVSISITFYFSQLIEHPPLFCVAHHSNSTGNDFHIPQNVQQCNEIHFHSTGKISGM